MAIIIIIINAFVHFAISNHRILYIPQICLCIFICSVDQSKKDLIIIKTFATSLLLINIFKIQYQIHRTTLYKYNQINIFDMQDIQKNIHTINPGYLE